MIPKAKYALIGGSGTWGMRFPEDLHRDDVRLLDIFEDGFDTPYGRSTYFKLIEIAGEPVLRVAMHGRNYRQQGVPLNPQWVCAHQVGWILNEAGVEYAMVESSVGGIQSPDEPGRPLPPWSVVVTDDTIMLWSTPALNPPLGPKGRNSRIGEPFCSYMQKILYKRAKEEPKFPEVYDHGIYITTPWGRFETSAEVKLFAKLGVHVAGQTLSHETVVMRKLGIHLGSLSIVSNYAEGVTDQWSGENDEDMVRFYYDCAPYVANVMVNAMKDVIIQNPVGCNCHNFFIEGHGAFPIIGA